MTPHVTCSLDGNGSRASARLEALRVGPSSRCAEALAGVLGAPLTRDCSVFDLLKRPEASYRTLTGRTRTLPG